MYISTKAQISYMDFAIGMFLFAFTLIFYFSYTDNFQKQNGNELDNMISDAKAISSSLVLEGYPSGWDNATVVRVGISEDQRINTTKLKYFKLLNYSFTKKIFATPYEYFVFFADGKGQVLNVDGVCGVGNPLVNTTLDIKSAYYYSDPAETHLKSLMADVFRADIFFSDDPSDIGDIDDLAANIGKYRIVVLEHPDLADAKHNDVDEEFDNYASSGGLLAISGQISIAPGKTIAGVDFYKKSGQSVSDRNSTVNYTQPYLSLSAGENIVFAQAYYVENSSSSSQFKEIATFNLDSRVAAARWDFGNGTAIFFSDFDAAYINGDFANVIEDYLKGIVEGTCTPINMTSLDPDRLVKTERYMNYKSKLVKMVVYLWQ